MASAGADVSVSCHATLAGLVAAHRRARLILVDIPIGLPWAELPVRPCDAAARRLLGRPRASSVFPAPCRAAVYAAGPRQARQVNRRVLRRDLSAQSLGILGKIREADALLPPRRRASPPIREVHPEVCFWALNGRPMLHKKSLPEGQEERLTVLRRYRSDADEVVAEALAAHPRGRVRPDDVIDALAAAVTAAAPASELRLVCEAVRDEKGLPMEIVYWSPWPAGRSR